MHFTHNKITNYRGSPVWSPVYAISTNKDLSYTMFCHFTPNLHLLIKLGSHLHKKKSNSKNLQNASFGPMFLFISGLYLKTSVSVYQEAGRSTYVDIQTQ